MPAEIKNNIAAQLQKMPPPQLARLAAYLLETMAETEKKLEAREPKQSILKWLQMRAQNVMKKKA